MSRPLPVYVGVAASALSAVMSIAGYRRAVASGLDAREQKVRLQRTLVKVAVDLFFTWRLSRLATRD